MEYRHTLKQAFLNLKAAKLRSALAMLGILVGTAAVVTLVSSGELATQKALEQFKSLGTDLLAVTLFSDKPSSQNQASNVLHINEAHELQKPVGVIALAPYMNLYVPVSYEGKRYKSRVFGVTETFQDLAKISLKKGRFISFLDHSAYYCIIGSELYKQIKAQNKKRATIKTHKKKPILGSQINIGKHIYTIIGIAKPWPENTFVYGNLNRAVIIPIESASVINRHAKINNIIFKLTKNADIDSVKQHITQLIHVYAPDLKTYFRSAKQLINSMRKQQGIFTLLLGLIGGIALLVGGIGIMNVMLVAVAERRREIGIRKAIGAKNAAIQQLFLSEAVILSLLGGLAGIIVGLCITFLVAYFTGWGYHVFLLPILLGFFVSAITGIFFGFYPAKRAAKLNPIDILRYE